MPVTDRESERKANLKTGLETRGRGRNSQVEGVRERDIERERGREGKRLIERDRQTDSMSAFGFVFLC